MPISEKKKKKKNCNAFYYKILKTSGTARLFETPGEQSQWLPLTKNTTFKTLQSFVKLPFIWLNNLKFVEGSHLSSHVRYFAANFAPL
jgi:hypothetical protein